MSLRNTHFHRREISRLRRRPTLKTGLPFIFRIYRSIRAVIAPPNAAKCCHPSTT